MTKDYLKFRNAIKKDDNLSLEESYLLETIFDYYNIELTYAYPPYTVLMSDLKTKRRAKVSKLLKSLVKKGYIKIIKRGVSNTYKLLKYLFLYDSKRDKPKKRDSKIKEHVDSNRDIPLAGQIDVDEAIETAEESKVIELTGFKKKEVKELLQLSELNSIVKAFNYAKEKGKVVFNYVRWCVKNLDKIIKKEPTYINKEKKLKFDNFEPRQYDYDNLEKGLLGWKDNVKYEDYCLYNPLVQNI